MEYRKTQIGTVILVSLVVLSFIMVNGYFAQPSTILMLAMIFIVLLAVLFSSMTIKVDNAKLQWFFGPKFWRKSVDLTDIKAAKKINTKWYYGYGIRLISTGWLYTVSGLTAIEVTLSNGTRVSLGTNDADNLLKAIAQRSAI